jgi:Fe-Mn family superoxide dismutase
MTITLENLPYDKKDLEPFISENTLNFHHGKHHQTYVTNLNNLIANTDLENKPLEELISISRENNKAGIFNNAAQIWNHTFYWHSMKKNGGGTPNGKLLAKIEEDFGSFDKFILDFKTAGATQFGSGWVWLVLDENGKLQIIKTLNAETPLGTNLKPLITMDVWEHAYYLDFQNARPKYIESFLNNLVNWDFALENIEK